MRSEDRHDTKHSHEDTSRLHNVLKACKGWRSSEEFKSLRLGVNKKASRYGMELHKDIWATVSRRLPPDLCYAPLVVVIHRQMAIVTCESLPHHSAHGLIAPRGPAS